MNAIAEWAGNVGQMGPIGQAQTAYSAYKGLSLADQMRKMAAMSGQRIDPWGTGGGREAAAGQLQGVVNGGSDAYMNTPAYKARIQAVQRAMAPYGNSGNLATAGAAAGGAGYNDYVQQMAALAGVGNGGQAGQLALSGTGAAADLTSKALATGAYGLTRSQPNQVPNASSSWFS